MITFDPSALAARLAELDSAMESPGFWEDQRAAAKVAAERARTQKKIETFEQLQDEAGELDFMLEQAADCLLYTSPSPRDPKTSRMPSSA